MSLDWFQDFRLNTKIVRMKNKHSEWNNKEILKVKKAKKVEITTLQM